MKKRFFLLIALAAIVTLLAAGCVGIGEKDPNGVLPSNRPGEWDGTTIGVPI